MSWFWIACVVLLVPGVAHAQTPVFEDMTEDLGFFSGQPPASVLDDTTVAWTDFDHDGWPDLVAFHQVWRNDGGVDFDLINLNLSGSGGWHYDLWGDYDLDGFPDIVSWAGDTSFSLNLSHNNGGNATFSSANSLLPTLPSRTDHSRAAAWGDFDRDGDLDLYIGAQEHPQTHKAEPDVMLENRGLGNGSWTDFSFLVKWEEPDTASLKLRHGRAVVACDFDEDGDLDIFVANYWEDKNYLWRNNYPPTPPDLWPTFTDVADDLKLNQLIVGEYDRHGYSIGAAWGDFNNDGHFDLFEANLKHLTTPSKPSKFYRNLGPSPVFPDPDTPWHFVDVTAASGLGWVETYASPALADFDNDGDLDFFLTADESTDDAVLYSNDGDFTFTNVTGDAGLSDINSPHQAGWADFDKDGDLDLVTNGQIWVNKLNHGTVIHSNRWIELELVGKPLTSPTNGRGPIVGAQVRITAPDITGTLARQVEAGTGQGNQNDTKLHFGLGSSDGPLEVELKWPDGHTCVLENIGARQICTVTWASAAPGCTHDCALDSDGDGVYDPADNCPGDPNPEQENEDEDPFGDVCDLCPEDESPTNLDPDEDTFGDVCDICPDDYNPNQDIIGDPLVTVLYPNGGETVRVGVPTNLTWDAIDTCGDVSSVDLRVYRDGLGGSYTTIASGIANSGTYAWTAPGPITNGFTAFLEVVATDPASNVGSDTSNAAFKIDCNVCVADFCREIGERCTSTGCTTAGCCGYTCVADPTCMVVEDCPPNSCIGCN